MKVYIWILKLISILILGILIGSLWIDFLKPDLFYLDRVSFTFKLIYLRLPQFGLPLLYVAIIFVLFLKPKKLRKKIYYLITILVILGFFSYPLMDLTYSRRLNNRMEYIKANYHPYFQLNPSLTGIDDEFSFDDQINIFCLGGSTTEFKHSNGFGWPSLLEQELNKLHNSNKFNVYNFGKQWYTTQHTLFNYLSNLRACKPDIIIVMHNVNDLLHNADFSYLSNGDYRVDYGHYLGPNYKSFDISGMTGTILKNFKNVKNQAEREIILQDSFPGLDAFSRNLNTLIDLANLDGTKVILMTQPYLYKSTLSAHEIESCHMLNFEAIGPTKKWDYRTALSGMVQYNIRIKEISSNRNTLLIDLEKAVPKDLVHFKDDVHYQDTSFQIMAKYISEILFTDYPNFLSE